MQLIILFAAILISRVVFPGTIKDAIPVQAHVIFRHGLRSPLWLYNNTPCPSSIYLDGLGEIMNDGLRTSYSLGQMLKKRYIDSNETKLLSETYSPKDFNIISSSSKRCIQSAMAVTAGLFPPLSTKREWHQNLNWYPIPIKSGKDDEDIILKTKYTKCSRLQQKLNQTYLNPKMIFLESQYKQFFEELTKLTGTKIGLESLNKLHQTLTIQKIDSQLHDAQCNKYPSWSNDTILNKLQEIIIKLENIIHEISDNELKTLLGGPFLALFTKRIKLVLNNANEREKLFLYSAHDTTLKHIFHSLSIPFTQIHSFSSAIFLEVYSFQERYIIKLFYKGGRGYSEDLREIDIPVCKEICFADILIKKLKDVASIDHDSECTRNESEYLRFD